MKCYHCGVECPKQKVVFFASQPFCCSGCKTVYQIIQDNNLTPYYEMNTFPGTTKNPYEKTYYDILDSSEIKKQFIVFENQEIIKVKLSIPQIHCSSCLWLLEHLKSLNPHILVSHVNFSKKEVLITLKKPFSLKALCILLDKIGYKPELKKQIDKPFDSSKRIYYKIGVAGFCFGNIMLLAFANYLNIDSSVSRFRPFFGYISLTLSLPVFFYSGSHYLKSALKALQHKFLNMDIPITIGMITLFIRSIYEILGDKGNGYCDSLSGFIFFLLIGKLIQQKTYDSLVFNRDYTSYLPMGVNCTKNGKTIIKKIDALEPNDIIALRHGELIPADGVLHSNNTYVNYSFVTGESDLSLVTQHKDVFAGGIINGKKVEIKLKKRVDNSYLTQLWNESAFSKTNSQKKLGQISNKISSIFTQTIVGIAISSGLFWYFKDVNQTWNVITAVLIVACPCALALSVPLTFGNIMRLMGQSGLYLRHSEVIEDLSKITDVILDKTGTLTHKEKTKITYKGEPLNTEEKAAIHSITINSMHPMSIAISNFLQSSAPTLSSKDFKEYLGQGIEGTASGLYIKLGSADFLKYSSYETETRSTQIHVSISHVYKGYFSIQQYYREGLDTFINSIKNKFDLHLLSGDNDKEKSYLEQRLNTSKLYFNLKPIEKMNYIKSLQDAGKRVLMLGDGLNDAGALKQSDVGISIADNIYHFSPACDAILNASKLAQLGNLVTLSKQGLRIVKWSFSISLIYNIIGLYFAITGQLSPIIAAILMPSSAASVAIFTSFTTNLLKVKDNLNEELNQPQKKH